MRMTGPGATERPSGTSASAAAVITDDRATDLAADIAAGLARVRVPAAAPPALRVHGADPSAALEAAFRRIERERMQGVPILNPALAVQAVHFERWQGQWLGALVTPWFLNLVLVPGDADRWRPAAEGERVFHRFAAGDFAFLGGSEPEVGAFQSCSLVSPMGQFADQATAVSTARAALAMLHVQRAPGNETGAAAAGAEPAPPPATGAGPHAPARRVFLFGRA